jgi:diamine N-acetyltransferase
MPEVAIRQGTSADADALSDLARRIFVLTFGDDPDHKPHDMAMFLANELSPATLAAELASDACWYFLARSGATLIGYLKTCVGHAPPCVPYRRTLEIGRLYVDFAWHGRGVAAGLMDTAVQQARGMGCDGMWLGVWHRNERAQRFYRKWGFTHVGEHPFIFGTDHQEDLVFACAMNLIGKT